MRFGIDRKRIRHSRNSLFEKVISHLVVEMLQRRRTYFAQALTIDRTVDTGAFSEKHDTMNTTCKKRCIVNESLLKMRQFCLSPSSIGRRCFSEEQVWLNGRDRLNSATHSACLPSLFFFFPF